MLHLCVMFLLRTCWQLKVRKSKSRGLFWFLSCFSGENKKFRNILCLVFYVQIINVQLSYPPAMQQKQIWPSVVHGIKTLICIFWEQHKDYQKLCKMSWITKQKKGFHFSLRVLLHPVFNATFSMVICFLDNTSCKFVKVQWLWTDNLIFTIRFR